MDFAYHGRGRGARKYPRLSSTCTKKRTARSSASALTSAAGTGRTTTDRTACAWRVLLKPLYLWSDILIWNGVPG